MTNAIFMWIVFGTVIVGMLVVDLAVFHRSAHAIKLKEAIIWSAVWIAAALLFNVGVYYELGHEQGLTFLTGYLIEKSLSMDNLFVFFIIFSYFKIPLEYQHKVLFWGILGALIFRGVFIAAGISIIQALHWMIYVLGAFLVFTGIKLAFEKDKEIHPEKNPVIRAFQKVFPISDTLDGNHFFIRQAGRFVATPLFITLIVLETTDIVFATDSIPAILGITVDPFLIFSSNIFAVLGLRALYFVLARIIQMFRYLHYGLSIILVFVGAKMLLEDFIQVPVEFELGIVGAILFLSILISLHHPSRKQESEKPPH